MKLPLLYYTLLAVGLLGNSAATLGQVPKSVDSLETFLKKYPKDKQERDTVYTYALAEYAYLLVYDRGTYREADSVGRQAEQLGRRIRYGMGLNRALVAQGAAFIHLNKFPEAIKRLELAGKEAKAYGLTQKEGNALSNIAAVYRLQKRYKEALAYAMQSLRLEEKYAIRPRNENIRRTLGFLLGELNQPKPALNYLKEGMAIARANNDLRSLATIENETGNLLDKFDQPKQAIPYFEQTIRHARASGYALVEADGLSNLGQMYQSLKQPTKALTYLQQALALSEKVGFRQNIANETYAIGTLYYDMQRYGAAKNYIKRALAIVTADSNRQSQLLFTEGLAELAYKEGNYREAFTYQRQLISLKDSLHASSQQADMQDIVARYESDKKESQITLLKQQAQLRDKEAARIQLRNNALLVGGLLILFLGAAVSAWLLNRAKLRRLEEAQHLRKQIAHDLHDEVGSTLSSISLLSGMVNSLIAQKRPEAVERAIQKINTDARQILEAMDEIIWTINPGNDSLQRIAMRLQEYAQPLMESKAISFSFQIDPALEGVPIPMEIRRSLYLIGKEAINNLIKYSEATEARVRFERKDSQLQVLIEDNGRGFDPAQPSQRTGQASMKQRAEAMGGSLEVRSAPEQGTSLVLTTSLA